jgi:tRNA dimethylallyltransferase
MNGSMPSVVAVVGPTATGKTDLGVFIAKALGSEVVSADSQLIYWELTIGTAKPDATERQGIPHHMIDVAAPTEVFSAAQYQAQAQGHLERLWNQGKLPVVVGGTGFYLKSLLEAEFIPDVAPNPLFREEMNALAQTEGTPALHHLLSEQDPQRAADLHPNDKVRLIRALEIIHATGQPVPRRNQPKRLSVLWLGLTYADRTLLDIRIDSRIEAMLQAGWLAEVETLIARYSLDAHALGVAHGYPELVKVVLGETSLAEATEQIRINVRQYARRQMTWFRKNPTIQWLACDEQPIDTLRRTVTDTLAQWQNS